MNEVEAKFVKAKIKGMNDTKAGAIATGTKNKQYAAVAGHRLIKKDNVQAALQKALKRHDITIDKTLAPIAKALTAKTRTYTIKTQYDDKGKRTSTETEIHEDDNLQLQLAASDRAVKLLGLDKPDKEPDTPSIPINNAELLEAIKNGDIAELQRIVFNKHDG